MKISIVALLVLSCFLSPHLISSEGDLSEKTTLIPFLPHDRAQLGSNRVGINDDPKEDKDNALTEKRCDCCTLL